MKSVLLVFAVGASAPLLGQGQPAVRTASVTLPASGEAAGQNNPPCTDGYTPTAAAVVLPQVYKAFDSYTGFPVAASLSTIIPGFDSWLASRLGVNNGPSVCASQCIAVPEEAIVQACMSDGADGTQCKNLADGDGPLAWAGTEAMSVAVEGGHKLVCSTGKNWSDNRARAYWLQSTF